MQYQLPDGQVIDVGSSKYRAPELLFRPDLVGEEYPGIHEVLTSAIQRSDIDLRKMLYSNVVLSGGSTMFKGLLLFCNWRHGSVCNKIVMKSQEKRCMV